PGSPPPELVSERFYVSELRVFQTGGRLILAPEGASKLRAVVNERLSKGHRRRFEFAPARCSCDHVNLAGKLLVLDRDAEVAICDLRAFLDRAFNVRPVTARHCEDANLNDRRDAHREFPCLWIGVFVDENQRRRAPLRIAQSFAARSG